MDVPVDIIKKITGEQTDSSICLAEVLNWVEREGCEPSRKKFNGIMEKIKAARPDKMY